MTEAAAVIGSPARVGWRRRICVGQAMLFIVVAIAALAALPARAHHSPAAYDLSREILVQGTVSELEWKNPHVYLTVETVGVDGASALQVVEAEPPSGLLTGGLTREKIAPGAHVLVRAAPRRSGSGAAFGLDVITSDGMVHALGPGGRSRTGAPTAPAMGIEGRWAPSGASFDALVRAASAWPLTEAAAAARADAAELSAFVAECAAVPFPQPMLMAIPALRTIETDADRVTIRIDWMGAERVVHLDAQHPDDLEPMPLGHSVGWWEGETLVVDTRGFAPHRQGVSFGVPSGPDKRLIERLTLTEDRRQLRYEVTLSDPQSLAEPVSFVAFWDHRPDLEPQDIPCDPAIARRFLELEQEG